MHSGVAPSLSFVTWETAGAFEPSDWIDWESTLSGVAALLLSLRSHSRPPRDAIWRCC
jgi:hypothetical protein